MVSLTGPAKLTVSTSSEVARTPALPLASTPSAAPKTSATNPSLATTSSSTDAASSAATGPVAARGITLTPRPNQAQQERPVVGSGRAIRTNTGEIRPGTHTALKFPVDRPIGASLAPELRTRTITLKGQQLADVRRAVLQEAVTATPPAAPAIVSPRSVEAEVRYARSVHDLGLTGTKEVLNRELDPRELIRVIAERDTAIRSELTAETLAPLKQSEGVPTPVATLQLGNADGICIGLPLEALHRIASLVALQKDVGAPFSVVVPLANQLPPATSIESTRRVGEHLLLIEQLVAFIAERSGHDVRTVIDGALTAGSDFKAIERRSEQLALSFPPDQFGAARVLAAMERESGPILYATHSAYPTLEQFNRARYGRVPVEEQCYRNCGIGVRDAFHRITGQELPSVCYHGAITPDGFEQHPDIVVQPRIHIPGHTVDPLTQRIILGTNPRGLDTMAQLDAQFVDLFEPSVNLAQRIKHLNALRNIVRQVEAVAPGTIVQPPQLSTLSQIIALAKELSIEYRKETQKGSPARAVEQARLRAEQAARAAGNLMAEVLREQLFHLVTTLRPFIRHLEGPRVGGDGVALNNEDPLQLDPLSTLGVRKIAI